MIPDTTLRGYLTGSIDEVLRLAGPRYVVVDYKTNKMFTGPVDAAQFDQAAMAAEMMRHHFPLQALLYSVALHRYLRWRQPGYRLEEHLGGVQDLCLRAMVGERTRGRKVSKHDSRTLRVRTLLCPSCSRTHDSSRVATNRPNVARAVGGCRRGSGDCGCGHS